MHNVYSLIYFHRSHMPPCIPPVHTHCTYPCTRIPSCPNLCVARQARLEEIEALAQAKAVLSGAVEM